MTMTLELDLDNRHAKYLGRRSFHSKVMVRTHRHTHTSHQTVSSDH